MSVTAKNLCRDEFFYGHKACAGCGGSLAVRNALKVLGKNAVAVLPAGCMSAVGFNFPQLCFANNAIISTFAGTASMLTGIEAGFRARGIKDFTAVGFAGDGGTADIGIQALSGAIDRNDNIIYICYDNEAYMNTGIQRSSATPMYADTTTTPAGKVSQGKPQTRKDLAAILAAHNIPYVGQTTFIGNMKDLYTKSERAIYTEGAAFLNVMAPCPRGWRYDAPDIIDVCKSAVETCYWPLFEVIDGKWILNYEPKKKLPIEDFLKRQGRFKHLFKPGNEELIVAFQAEVDRRWEELLERCHA